MAWKFKKNRKDALELWMNLTKVRRDLLRQRIMFIDQRGCGDAPGVEPHPHLDGRYVYREERYFLVIECQERLVLIWGIKAIRVEDRSLPLSQIATKFYQAKRRREARP